MSRKFLKLPFFKPTLLLGALVFFSGCVAQFNNPSYDSSDSTSNTSSSSSSSSGSGLPSTITVSALYTSYPNWLDWLRNDGARGIYHASESACGGFTPRNCLHGGEMKKVEITGWTDCSTLSITDSESAFVWECIANGTDGAAVFYSRGLADNKHLTDLIDGVGDDGAGFKSMYVTVTDSGSGSSVSSSSEKWWTNDIALLPDNSASSSGEYQLDGTDDGGNDEAYDQGTILILTADRATQGYQINQTKMAIVTMGYTLTYGGDNTDHCLSATSECIIDIVSQTYPWVEGKFDVNAAAGQDAWWVINADVVINGTFRNIEILDLPANRSGMYFKDSRSNNFHEVEISSQRVGSYGFYIQNGDYNRFSNINVLGMQSYGAYLDNSGQWNYWINSRFTNNGNNGLYHRGHNNIIYRTISYNNSGVGIRIDGDYNRLVQVVSSNNGNEGIYSEDDYGYYAAVTTINNGLTGFQGDDDRATYSSILAANNGVNGIYSLAPQDVTYSQIAALHNATGGINVWRGIDGNAYGNIVLGGNGTNCILDDGGGAITDLAFADAACTDNNGSSTTKLTGQVLTNSFYDDGKLGSPGDSENTLDSNGQDTFSNDPTLFDWFNFEHIFRAWGQDGSAFANADNRGRCVAGTCQIWDFSLATGDSVIRNNSKGLTTDNNTFTAGAACPSEVDGGEAITNQAFGGVDTYLLYAFEIPDDIPEDYPTEWDDGNGTDYSGDDNGVCESGEACIYTPNFGAYQGHGDYSSNNCTFSNGTVSNVLMFFYPDNGY